MAMYVTLVPFTDQGIRNIKDTIKRSEAAMAEAEKMGMKIIEAFWTVLASLAVEIVLPTLAVASWAPVPH